MLNLLSRRARAALLALGLILPLAGMAGDNPIVVGQVIDLTGPNGPSGRDYVAGITTHFDGVNAAGGIHGRPLRLIVRDDAGKPALAAKAVTELIEQERADYLLGGIGEQSVQAVLGAPAFVRSSHLLFAPLSVNKRAGAARVLHWRPSHESELDYLLAHFSKLGMHSVGIAYQDSAAYAQAFESVKAKLASGKLKLTAAIKIDGEHPALAREVERFAGARPGFVLVIGDTIGSALFLKAFRQRDAQTFVAGTSLVNLTTLREFAGARAVEWTVFSQVVPDPAAGASKLQIEHIRLMKLYRDESVSSLTLEGFAAAKTLTLALKQAKPGKREVLQELVARSAELDLGGLPVTFKPAVAPLSSHLDIALFSRTRLKF